MTAYRRAWLVWWLVPAAAGTVAAVLLWQSSLLLLVLMSGATLGAGIAVYASTCDDAPEGVAGQISPGRATVAAAAGAVAATGAGGWVEVSAPGAFALLVIAVASSPWVVRAVLGRTPREVDTEWTDAREPGEEPLEHVIANAASVEEACRCFSTMELCQAWHQTFTEVGRPHDRDQQLRLLLLREAFLEELGRRDPEGLHAWMSSRVPVSLAPTAFFARRPPEVIA